MMLPPLPSPVWPTPIRTYALILGLIGLCTGIELFILAADWGLIGSPRWRALGLQYGAFWSGLLRDWQPNYPAQPWLMFCTYAFLHVGPMHLLGNMLALLWLGPMLQDRLGRWGFCALWASGAAGGALCFAALSTAPAPMVGASGAVFGLLGAVVVLDYLKRGALSAVLGMTAVLAGLNGLMFVLEKGALAWETHLGGYLAGILITAALSPAKPA